MSDVALKIQFQYLGLTPYAKALRMQIDLHTSLHAEQEQNRKSSRPAIVLGLEHPAVITLGKRASREADLIFGEDSSAKPEIAKVERGGQATLHSEGQLVIYPILPIRAWNLSVHDYVDHLQASTQAFLQSYGVESHRKGDEPGLYTKKGKIAFFGVQVRHGITMHGLSINIHNDLKLFSQIRSCGITNAKFDRLSDCLLAHSQSSMSEHFANWQTHFLGSTRSGVSLGLSAL